MENQNLGSALTGYEHRDFHTRAHAREYGSGTHPRVTSPDTAPRGRHLPRGRLLVDYHSVSSAEEGRVEHQVDSDAVDRYAGRVMGVYGDIGPTVPSPESPPDRPLTD